MTASVVSPCRRSRVGVMYIASIGSRRRDRHNGRERIERGGRHMTGSREEELLASVPDGLFIGGQWRAAEGGKKHDVDDPSTGAVIRTIAAASVADGQATKDAAADPLPGWGSPAVRQRADVHQHVSLSLMATQVDVANTMM